MRLPPAAMLVLILSCTSRERWTRPRGGGILRRVLRRAGDGELIPVVIASDGLLSHRKLTVAVLAQQVRITAPANLAVLKSRADTALVGPLNYQPGGLLCVEPDDRPRLENAETGSRCTFVSREHRAP